MKKEETAAERAERLEAERRAEASTIAKRASPQAGTELDEGSDARKAKIKEAKAGAKKS